MRRRSPLLYSRAQMGLFHSHNHSHAHGEHTEPKAALIKALSITLMFMVVEVIGGWFANSLALVSDGAHMLTDAAALGLSLFAYWMAQKPSTPTMSFGYHRVEILGALANGLMIWVIAGYLVYEAFLRMSSPPEVKGPLVFVIAALGLAANLVSMKILHPNQGGNINVRAAYIHLFADMVGSIGVLIAGMVLWITDWRPIDPLVTLLSAVLMLVSSWELVKESIGVLMESAPAGVDPEMVKSDLMTISDVQEAHDLHIWTVSSGKLALSVHLISPVGELVLAKANELLFDKYGIFHTTIQVEHPDRFKSERCYDCASG